MPSIDFEAKTDRELLIMTAQACNAIDKRLAELNGTVRQHSERLTKLETKARIECEAIKENKSLTRIFTYIGIIAAIIGIIIGVVGKVARWW